MRTLNKSTSLLSKSFGFFRGAATSVQRRPAYLDFQATTPLDPRVLDSMMPYMLQKWGNSGSTSHSFGLESRDAVEKARKQVAALIGAEKDEIIFTSGATESGNLAIKGLAKFHQNTKKHLITLQTEHKCILDTCRSLEREGFEVTYLKVLPSGQVDLGELEAAIREDTLLVSVMHINNEIGVIQDIEAIGQICKKRGIYFHSDGAQSVGKIPVDVRRAGVDLLSISGHKIYGPKGIGGLFVRKQPRVRLAPILSGGGQERGLRSGTLPIPLVAGLGAACEIAQREMKTDSEHISRLSARLLAGIKKNIPAVVVNGENTYPGCVNVSFMYVEGESVLLALKDFALSSGSACTSASLEPSYVLRALAGDSLGAHSSIRFGIGKFTTEAEIDHCVAVLAEKIASLRAMSPLWEMAQKNIDLSQIKWSP